MSVRAALLLLGEFTSIASSLGRKQQCRCERLGTFSCVKFLIVQKKLYPIVFIELFYIPFASFLRKVIDQCNG